jgi:hypothetical protein
VLVRVCAATLTQHHSAVLGAYVRVWASGGEVLWRQLAPRMACLAWLVRRWRQFISYLVVGAVWRTQACCISKVCVERWGMASSPCWQKHG